MLPFPEPSSVRPCFLSGAQRDEFEKLVRLVTSSLWGCGVDHAWGVARDLAGLSHDASAIMRCARAEHAAVSESRLGMPL